MILKFAFVGALVALVPVPGVSFVLIPMEIFLLYKIMKKYNAFEVPTFVAAGTGLVAASAFLKAMASWLYLIVGLGSLANALVAFGFIMAFGGLAEHHYASKISGGTGSKA